MENQVTTPEMTVKDWLITFLIMAIPIVGFVMLFVWGFGNDGNRTRAEWAKAKLLWIALVAAFAVFLAIIFGATIMTIVNQTGSSF